MIRRRRAELVLNAARSRYFQYQKLLADRLKNSDGTAINTQDLWKEVGVYTMLGNLLFDEDKRP